jgi:putative transposase
MVVRKSYKVGLCPNNRQKGLFFRFAGTTRWAYNWGLSQKKMAYEKTGKNLSCMDLNKLLVLLKRNEPDFDWLNGVGKSIPQESLRNLDKAFGAFFKKKTGFPKFKSRKHSGLRFQTQQSKNTGNHIYLPRIGYVKLKEKGFLPDFPLTSVVTIKEKAGKWFLTVCVEEEMKPLPPNQEIVGIDLGLTQTITLSDGIIFNAPKPLKRFEKKLSRAQRTHSKKQKGSKNKEKSRKRLAKLHFKISNIRSNFFHNISNAITKQFGVIVVENLNLKGLVRTKLGKAFSDVALGEFLRQIKYKANWTGRQLVIADRWFPSTKMCSGCGNIKEVKLSERIYICPICGLEINRDLNAALNLKNLAVKSTVKACGEEQKTFALGMQPSVKQELSSQEMA